MPNLNQVFLIGNLTREPEVRYLPKGTAVAEISLAINRSFKGADGAKKEETSFVDCVLWERLAELAGEYLKKGSSVFIQGRLETSTWDDKTTGQKRSKLRVRGESMQFLGGKPDGQARQGRPQAQEAPDDSQGIPF